MPCRKTIGERPSGRPFMTNMDGSAPGSSSMRIGPGSSTVACGPGLSSVARCLCVPSLQRSASGIESTLTRATTGEYMRLGNLDPIPARGGRSTPTTVCNGYAAARTALFRGLNDARQRRMPTEVQIKLEVAAETMLLSSAAPWLEQLAGPPRKQELTSL